jgi:lipoprotein-anchoring transpeptidase ErfK/SrfK
MGRMQAHVPRLAMGLLASLTLVLSVGGALGAWPTGAPASGEEQPLAAPRAGDWAAAARMPTRDMEGPGERVRSQGGSDEGTRAPAVDDSDAASRPADKPRRSDRAEGSDEATLPPRSGSGRRVVFDMSEQRVWLVTPADRVRRTYLVSGSAVANLGPGHYEVYSRSRHAVSYDYEETMRYMVRFTQGERAAIGFHDIPRDDRGRPVQTRAQLGTPLSSGCIRQARPDAVALWRFAGVGTSVVVVR